MTWESDSSQDINIDEKKTSNVRLTPFNSPLYQRNFSEPCTSTGDDRFSIEKRIATCSEAELRKLIDTKLKEDKLGDLNMIIGNSGSELKRSIVEKVLGFSEALTEGEFRVHWDDLPDELKKNCIDWMPFNLRQTCKKEKKIVDSCQVNFNFVGLGSKVGNRCMKSIELSICDVFGYERYFKYSDRSEFMKNGALLLVYILNVGKIRTFDLELDDELTEKMIDLFEAKNTTFDIFKFINIRSPGVRLTRFILEKCKDGLEEISFNPDGCEESELRSMFTMSTFFRAKYIQMWHVKYPSIVTTLFEKWIEMDAEIGTDFELDSDRMPVINAIWEKFPERILSQNKYFVTEIQMNTTNKRILVDNDSHQQLGLTTFFFTVIDPKAITFAKRFGDFDRHAVKRNNAFFKRTRLDRKQLNAPADNEVYVPEGFV